MLGFDLFHYIAFMSSNCSTLKGAFAFLLVFSGSRTFYRTHLLNLYFALTLLTFVFPLKLFLFSPSLLVKSSLWNEEKGRGRTSAKHWTRSCVADAAGSIAQHQVGRRQASAGLPGERGSKALHPWHPGVASAEVTGNKGDIPPGQQWIIIALGREKEQRRTLNNRFALPRADFTQSLARQSAEN